MSLATNDEVAALQDVVRDLVSALAPHTQGCETCKAMLRRHATIIRLTKSTPADPIAALQVISALDGDETELDIAKDRLVAAQRQIAECRAQAAAHTEEIARLKLVVETKGSLHDANLCTHYLENKAKDALVAEEKRIAQDAVDHAAWCTRKLTESETLVARLVEALEKSKRSHKVVEEDCWYSCPKSGECCNDESDKTKCDCGADAYNAGVDALLAEIAPTPTPKEGTST